jgi:hypothetical protein
LQSDQVIQVEQVLGGATKELFQTREVPGVVDPETGVTAPSTFDITGTKNYTPYSVNPADYVAGFSPLQQQVHGGRRQKVRQSKAFIKLNLDYLDNDNDILSSY